MFEKSEVFAKLQEKTFRFRSEKELYRLFRADTETKRQNLLRALDGLRKEGAVVLDKNGKYVTAKELGALPGTVQGSDRGFAFFVPDDKTQPDLFLPARSLRSAMHKDRVLVRKADKTSSSSDEGEVLAVLSRGMERVSGRYEKYGDFATVTPDEKRFPGDVVIEKSGSNGAKAGDKVLVRITRFPHRGGGAEGVVEEILTAESELKTEELAVIRSYGLAERFPEEVVKLADRVAADPVETDGRSDLRELLTVTIDGEDTRDFDDAVSLTDSKEGTTLYVHIADVSHYVTEGDALDREALARGTSVYFPDRTVPMLPEALSNGACSLNPGEPRYALTVMVAFDKEGVPLHSSLTESVIVSDARLTYGGVNRLLEEESNEAARFPAQDGKDGVTDGKTRSEAFSVAVRSGKGGESERDEEERAAGRVSLPIKEMLQKMARLAGILSERRKRRGAIDLSVREAKIVCQGESVTVEEAARGVSERMIEEFMILANEAVAAYAFRTKAPFVYRVHETPAPEKMGAFAEFLNGLGVSADLGGKVTSRDLQGLLQREAGSPHAALFNLVLLRSMQKARYDTRNLGHFGLASACYCHFTSPIRRYPDLTVHRALKGALHGKAFTGKDKKTADVAAKESSARELVAAEAERAVDDLYKTYFMGRFIGETMDAVVSGVTNFGVFAETDFVTEGLIRISRLPHDRYELDEAAYTLRGRNHTFSLGKRVRVRVISANLAERRVEFDFVTEEEQGGVIAANQAGKGGKPSGKSLYSERKGKKSAIKGDERAPKKGKGSASGKRAQKPAAAPRKGKEKKAKGRADPVSSKGKERVSPRGGRKRYTDKRQG